MEYLRRRELNERAAAKRATCLRLRAAHQELAQLYAREIARLLQQPFSAEFERIAA